MLSGTKSPNSAKNAGIRVSRKTSAIFVPSSAVQRSRRNGSSCGSWRDARDAEERVEDDQDDPEDERRLEEAEEAADDLVERTAPSGTAAAACRSSGRRARRRSTRRRRPSRTRSCSCTPAGTASSSRPGSSPSGSARFAASRNENRIDAMPIRRRIVPWAKPRTKKPMKYRTMSRSTVLDPFQERFRHPRGAPPWCDAPGGAESGARVAAAIREPQGNRTDDPGRGAGDGPVRSGNEPRHRRRGRR